MYRVYLEKIYKIYIFCGMWSDRPVNCFSSDDSGKYRSKAKQQETLMWWPLPPLIDEKNSLTKLYTSYVLQLKTTEMAQNKAQHTFHEIQKSNRNPGVTVPSTPDR